MKVRIIELADRYLIVNAETDVEMEGDDVGFSNKSSAISYAKHKGWEILP
jgi:hypothetical protein